MSLLAGKAYDPATAVSKATTAALAMTAIDTTNLRVAFTAPANGTALVRLQGTLHGATTYPQILLGVVSGATVLGRVAPAGLVNGVAAATTFLTVEAQFLVTGLTPGSAQTWDAAYGVETAVASTGLKYGGPNNTTANDAFGAFLFEVWDVA
ncbi:hypothetical protein G7075_19980 [Phycicoccus sp. HDW14]|uniref:hypothetical protein n=1 Tax=Phycicoccus sp. HDW14 TaxID=2714941 RepID=UPI00140B9BB1|nr:hypothetical protein [Phycicoccus sp. HDW14]QIM22875.1 hypothetical protein G7075_19980 [Phycicoccus sp. HDW14]